MKNIKFKNIIVKTCIQKFNYYFNKENKSLLKACKSQHHHSLVSQIGLGFVFLVLFWGNFRVVNLSLFLLIASKNFLCSLKFRVVSVPFILTFLLCLIDEEPEHAPKNYRYDICGGTYFVIKG